VRLAQLTNKYFNKDFKFSVKECGEILGVTDKIKNKNDSKAMIRYVLEQLVCYTLFCSTNIVELSFFQEIESRLSQPINNLVLIAKNVIFCNSVLLCNIRNSDSYLFIVKVILI